MGTYWDEDLQAEVEITHVTGQGAGNPEPMLRVRVHRGSTKFNLDPYPSVPYP